MRALSNWIFAAVNFPCQRAMQVENEHIMLYFSNNQTREAFLVLF